ncbi:hypothetical protein [Celerinatantimonas diazotrophica]|uniref:hypothetical protein n=1 Tax=Celerinatantimonas diazotrophica TaxID=412034 RepID=UPI0010444975|nr:hypothetical protein [Celerinatantimonas diazotrophica]
MPPGLWDCGFYCRPAGTQWMPGNHPHSTPVHQPESIPGSITFHLGYGIVGLIVARQERSGCRGNNRKNDR